MLTVTRAVLLLSLLFALAPACAQDDDTPAEVREFLAGWAAKMQRVRTLEVRFTQTKRLRMLRRPLISKGYALLIGPRLLMVIEDGEGGIKTALQVEPGQARLYHPGLKRLEVFALREGAPPPTPFPLFGGDVQALPKDYVIERSRDDDETDLLVFTPRSEDAVVSEFRMWFRNYTVVAVEQRGKRGDAVTMEIERFVINPTLDPEALELELAPGTTVVHVGEEEQ
jgi:outer membrane lipoprotein-sorting protein